MVLRQNPKAVAAKQRMETPRRVPAAGPLSLRAVV